MKFKVDKHDSVISEIQQLTHEQQETLNLDYKKIEEDGIEFVYVKSLGKKLFEIKTNEIRSLFKYAEGKIIVVGVVFVKKTQKTPSEKIKLAQKRLKGIK